MARRPSARATASHAGLPAGTAKQNAAPVYGRGAEGVPSGQRPENNVEAFTFGEPESILDRSEFIAMLESVPGQDWYHPPISMFGLAKSQHMSAHHASAVRLKRNLLSRSFTPTRLMTRPSFERLVIDFLLTGNCYGERRDNLAGRPLDIKPALALHTRVGVEEGRFFWVKGSLSDFEFRPGSVWHLKEDDIVQEIYGIPEWYAALQSGLLNEAATLFRRRYYKNGSHAGFIFYIGEEKLSDTDSNNIRKAMKDAKGPGNFRNLYLHIPGGKEKGVQIIPISEVAARDEFVGIKNVTRDDMLAAHRCPPQLLGVVPTNSAGFGSITDAAGVFFDHEIVPLQEKFRALNDWLGVEAVRFNDWRPGTASA